MGWLKRLFGGGKGKDSDAPPTSSGPPPPRADRQPPPRPRQDPDPPPRPLPRQSLPGTLEPKREAPTTATGSLSDLMKGLHAEDPELAKRLEEAFEAIIAKASEGPRCLAEETAATCPRQQCRHTFHSEVWVVVDVQERPDLAAKCLDGSIHDVACPRCGQTFAVNAPLLYHDSQAEKLVLAVDPDLPESEKKAVNKRLVGHLFLRLGHVEGVAYLNTTRVVAGLAGLRVSLLPAKALFATVEKYLTAETWTASMRVVQEHPELLSDEADKLLEIMAEQGKQFDATGGITSKIEEHRHILARCRAVGIKQAFAEKLGLSANVMDLLDSDPAETDPQDPAAAIVRRLGQIDDPLAFLEAALGDAFPADDPKIFMLRGHQAERQHRLTEASEWYVKALELYEKRDDRPGQILALENLGDVFQASGKIDLALSVYQRALTIAEELADPKSAARVQKSMGALHVAKGEYDKAQEFFASALKVYQDGPYGPELAGLHNSMGILSWEKKQYQQAEDLFRQSLGFYLESDDEEGAATIYANLSAIYAEQEKFDPAIEMFEKAQAIHVKKDNPVKLAQLSANVGIIYLKKEDYPRALELFQKAREIAEKMGLQDLLANIFGNLGLLHSRQKNFRDAISCFNRAIELADQLGVPSIQATSYFNLGNLYFQQDDKEKAKTAMRRAKELYGRLGKKDEEAKAMLFLLLLGDTGR